MLQSRYESVLERLRQRYLDDPESATWRQWKEIEARQKSERPLAYFLLKTLPQRLRLLRRSLEHQLWKPIYRLHPAHRYHLIDTRLKPGYWDLDERLLHGAMALLVEYVEEGHGGAEKLAARIAELKVIDNDEAILAERGLRGPSYRSEEEALAIYRWWTVERPAALEREGARLDAIDFDLLDFTGPEEDYLNHPDYPKFLAWRAAEESCPGDSPEALAARDQEMLERFVAIRCALWT